MNCEKCGKCTYQDVMKELCLSKEAREKLLELIEDGIQRQMSTENFLYDRGYTPNMMKGLSKGVRMHFDCLLPDRIN